MLLLVTNREDLTADWLVLELQRRGAPYVRFNTEDYPQRWKLHWRVGDAQLELDGQHVVTRENIAAVWFRRPVAPRPRPGLAADEEAWAIRESAEALDGFWRTLDARWVSPPTAIRLADSKLKQLTDAVALGFEVPETQVTSDPARVRALLKRSSTGLICKPLRDGRVRSAGRSLLFTSVIENEQIDQLGDEPHLFQALVPKRYDVRVTVIGDDVFGTRIQSQHDVHARVDWRRATPSNLHFAPERLPADLAERSRTLVHQYGLSFGAIDLARQEDGSYTFFELNPNGQWAFIEQRTGQPLRACLADLLLGGG